MLIASLLPLLSRYSLGFDLVAGPDDRVTLTVMPRKTEGAKRAPEASEVRPISITAPAAEIDAELARGTDGALGQLFAARKSLGDQIAAQQAAAEVAVAEAKEKAAKAKRAGSAARASKSPAKPDDTPPAPPPAPEPKPGEPASLW